MSSTLECLNCVDLFNTPIGLKPCSGKICNDSDQFQTKTRKISHCGSRPSIYVQLVVLQKTAKKCTKNYNARAQPLFCLLNLFLVTFSLASPSWFAELPSVSSERGGELSLSVTSVNLQASHCSQSLSFRLQRPGSFSSTTPRIATSGLIWFLSIHRVFVSYRFVRFEGKSVNRGLQVLDRPRGRHSWC